MDSFQGFWKLEEGEAGYATLESPSICPLLRIDLPKQQSIDN